MIRELLSEKLITLVFGVVYNPERILDVVSIIEVCTRKLNCDWQIETKIESVVKSC